MPWMDAVRDPSWAGLNAGVRRWLARGAKYLRQARRGRVAGRNVAAFLVGCQRSGTSMTIAVFERSPETWVYGEDHPAAFDNFRLRSRERVAALVKRSFVSPVLFKPICDSHLTDQLLDEHPGSRALWIYRDYRDVVNSLVRMFGDHQKEIIRGIHDRDWDRLGWRGERLPQDLIEFATELWRPEMPVEEAGALVWLIRNRFFFDLELHGDERVLLVRYEDLVRSPVQGFGRMFSFLGAPFDPAIVADVHDASVGRNAFPEIDERVRSRCEEMLRRLDQAYGVHESAPLQPGEQIAESAC